MTLKGSVGQTQAERSAESSQRLLAAAIDLIAEKGFERTTAAEIGQRAGYSRAMVRARYGTKEALLESLLRTEYEPMFLAEPAPAGRGLDIIIGHLEHLADQAVDKSKLLRAFFTLCFETVGPVQQLGPWLRNWLAQYRATALEAFLRGQADGSIRPHLDAQAETRRLMNFGLGLAFRWTLEPQDVDFVGEVRHQCDWLRGYYAPGPSD